MIDLWKGIANTWDCDEMGHMNVRVYIEKAFEGLGHLAGACHLSHAFRPDAASTLIPAEQHIRFIKEVHPGLPLSMVGCTLEVDETGTTVYQEMRHGDGSVAAAFRTKLLHVDATTLKPFPWTARSRAALEALGDEPPASTAPRGLDLSLTPSKTGEVTRAIAMDRGAKVIGLGMVPPGDCDVFGRMNPHMFIGRISDSVPNLLHDWRSRVASAVPGQEMGGAVLENRIIYRRWPKAGDLYEIRSSLGRVEEKVHSLVHWMLDPLTGQPWMTAEAVAVTFDLKKRKVIPTPAEMMDELADIAPGELSL
ncbi:thioesterase family protein [Henriciella sp. AS95]|uniref:thioesterase family protein n=1 Tax=Henriciella sp. AS95 TaxID=3135782 RepID=UPI00316E5B56